MSVEPKFVIFYCKIAVLQYGKKLIQKSSHFTEFCSFGLNQPALFFYLIIWRALPKKKKIKKAKQHNIFITVPKLEYMSIRHFD